MIGYLIAFLFEIVGMSLIFWIGVPIFRALLQFRQTITVSDEIIFLAAVVLIQFTYWTRLRYDPPFNLSPQPFVGHLILFASRLSFIFASAVFSLVVYRNPEMFQIDPLRTPLMAAVLFSVFCFSRHLERIGLLLLGGFKPTQD